MGLWAIKYSDEHQKWWVDVVLQDAPPPVAGARWVPAGTGSQTAAGSKPLAGPYTIGGSGLKLWADADGR